MNTLATLFIASWVTMVLADRLNVPTILPRPAHRVVSTTFLPNDSLLPLKPRDVALVFAKKQFKLNEGDYVVKNAYTSHNGVTHVYLKQLLKGIEVTNADMNINVDKSGAILSYGSTFLPITAQVLAKSKAWDGATRKASPVQAFKTFARHIGLDASTIQETNPLESSDRPTFALTNAAFTTSDVPVDQTYIQTPDGVLVAAWRMTVRMKHTDNHFHAHVAADGSTVLRLVDWTASASYRVLKIGDNDPGSANLTFVTDPANLAASPKGWHTQGPQQFTTTIGNNVLAQENWDGKVRPNASDYFGNKRPDGGQQLVFDYPIDITKSPKDYYQAAVTNLFYVNNMMHDIFYMYGFDEQSGNFQHDNLDKGGLGGDEVIATAQDGSWKNNANFETPPDGQNGRMRMYIFDTTTPNRDGDLCNDIIIHEYGHGISTRLTGGPANSDCLSSYESGGMSEGWSDLFSILLQLKPTDTSGTTFKSGAYVNQGKSIRRYDYSTSMDIHPATFALIQADPFTDLNTVGMIWANTLYQAYWNLHGEMEGRFAEWYSADKTAANTLLLQLVVDGLKLQPCNPTFIDARDALLQAEQVATGKYACALWKAFAKRGLGVNAKSTQADFTLPPKCTP
jgi:extracellular elastinolytic metalloproteinase